ncbi:hypothetical protein [Caulobacter sp. RHG1]|uniref:hypothetical protein n=1 Tax=Caulobacter sp. (strain RHG1) TaxID=2545762 RepID=UPI001556C823|nr:hypothetical protein [Caulobacter sp. RHG1]NQE61403.1 hypothetical protein [Caulobacter sp. RHG1]
MPPPPPPFKIDISSLLETAARGEAALYSPIAIDLPFLTLLVEPTGKDARLGRELLVRMRDRRVLDQNECCDDCIDRALVSLQEVRSALVAVQLELAKRPESPLALLTQLMAAAIRQFLTYEQRLNASAAPARDAPRGDAPEPRPRPWEIHQAYRDALERLRGHLNRCLGLIAVIAEDEAFAAALNPHYQGPWPLDAYVTPIALDHLTGT